MSTPSTAPLTREQIEHMPAGPKMDALVAERLHRPLRRWGAIECQGTLDGPELVMRMLTASPAAICRAIILAMPERDK